MKIPKIFAILLAGAAILTPATGPTPAVQAAEVSVGAGLGLAPDYEGSQDFTVALVPYVNVAAGNNMSFNLLGNKARLNLVPSPMWKAGVAGEYIPERSDVSSSRVDNMQNVDAAFMAGGFAGFDYEEWSASLEALADVSGANDGVIVRLNGGYRVPINQSLSLSLGVFTTWADDNYMETYFSVSKADAMRSGLRQYKAGYGMKDVGASLTATYQVGTNWGLKGLASYKSLLGDAADSPLVDEEGSDSQFAASILAYYTF